MFLVCKYTRFKLQSQKRKRVMQIFHNYIYLGLKNLHGTPIVYILFPKHDSDICQKQYNSKIEIELN